MIDLQLVRYFLAVVDTGGFTKAAERVAVTQPSLSAGVKKLEETLGTPLFVRSKRRVFLTGAGTKFLVRANAMMREYNLAIRELAESHEPVTLRLGVIRTVPIKIVADLAETFAAAGPMIAIDVVEGGEIEVMNALNAQAVDCAITLDRGQPPSYERTQLLEEGYSLALSAAHPLAGEKRAQPAAFQDQAMVIRARCEALSETSRFFTSHNVRPRFSYRTDNDERALAMVGAGLGATVMPDSYRAPNVARVKMQGFNLKRVLVLLSAKGRRDADMEKALAAFRASALHVFSKLA